MWHELDTIIVCHVICWGNIFCRVFWQLIVCCMDFRSSSHGLLLWPSGLLSLQTNRQVWIKHNFIDYWYQSKQWPYFSSWQCSKSPEGCFKCDTISRNNSNLNAHVREDHEELKPCDFCETKFTTNDYSAEWCFKCVLCDKNIMNNLWIISKF